MTSILFNPSSQNCDPQNGTAQILKLLSNSSISCMIPSYQSHKSHLAVVASMFNASLLCMCRYTLWGLSANQASGEICYTSLLT